jgi:uncharacterized protein YkwD
MRTWPLVFLGLGAGLGACGPIYPDQQPARQAPEPAPAQTSGPPGGGGMPADDPWSAEEPAGAPATRPMPSGPPGQPDDPYARTEPPAQRPAPRPPDPPARPEPPRPPARPEPPRPAGLSADAQALLDAHNRVRARHCAAPLQWSPQLAQVAQQWANSLRDQGCKFGHSGGKYGENLAAGTSGTLDGQAVTAMWYDEVKQYSFPNGGFSMETGHFTQVVWRQSTQLGCAISTCRGMDIWVCEYDPPGNVQGMFRQNVLPTGCK